MTFSNSLNILNDLKIELPSNSNFLDLNNILNCKHNNSAGFYYAKNLFYCRILCYYDKFRNFEECLLCLRRLIENIIIKGESNE